MMVVITSHRMLIFPITPDPDEKPPVEPPYETPLYVDLDFDEELFETSQKAWTDSNIINYEFTITRNFYGLRKFMVTVRVLVKNNEIISVKFVVPLKFKEDLRLSRSIYDTYGNVWICLESL